MDNKQLNDLIHSILLPAQQRFHSYEQLAHNPSFHIDPKCFKKCALTIEEVIIVVRDLAKEEK